MIAKEDQMKGQLCLDIQGSACRTPVDHEIIYYFTCAHLLLTMDSREA